MIEIQCRWQRRVQFNGSIEHAIDDAKHLSWVYGFCDVIVDGVYYATWFLDSGSLKLVKY